MDEVKIEKDKLLKKIKQNREDHRLIYEEAMDGWREEVLSTLKNAVKLAESNEEYITYFDLPKPTTHLAEYNRIIEMIEWHVDDIIELDAEEFNKFVRDIWNWSNDFLSNSMHYGSSSSSSSSSTMSLMTKKMGDQN